jgi:hypothetical protein
MTLRMTEKQADHLLRGKKLSVTERPCKSVGFEQKRSKYGNVIVKFDGYTFDSIGEMKHYKMLKNRLRANEISNLRVHPVYKLEINGIEVTTYEPDFVYDEQGETKVEDVKGFRTKEFIIKKRLMLALLGIDVREIPLREKKSGKRWIRN